MSFTCKRLLVALSGRDKRIIRDLVRRLREALEGCLEQVIVYGSRAHGDYKVGSDLDVLILVNDLDASLKQCIREIRYRVMWEADFEPLIPLLCLEEAEFSSEIRRGSDLAADIEHEGCLVYERER